VIDREHMGIFLTDEGHWKRAGVVITFSPKDPKKSSYQATENEHSGKTFLSITSPDAAAGIVISAEDTDKELDADPNHLPDHVLFKVSAKTYQIETKQTYPFRYIGRQRWMIGEKSPYHSLTPAGGFECYRHSAHHLEWLGSVLGGWRASRK
jgi:hypothetical protein